MESVVRKSKECILKHTPLPKMNKSLRSLRETILVNNKSNKIKLNTIDPPVTRLIRSVLHRNCIIKHVTEGLSNSIKSCYMETVV